MIWSNIVTMPNIYFMKSYSISYWHFCCKVQATAFKDDIQSLYNPLQSRKLKESSISLNSINVNVSTNNINELNESLKREELLEEAFAKQFCSQTEPG